VIRLSSGKGTAGNPQMEKALVAHLALYVEVLAYIANRSAQSRELKGEQPLERLEKWVHTILEDSSLLNHCLGNVGRKLQAVINSRPSLTLGVPRRSDPENLDV
jgi:hypothetical protein